MAKKQSWGAWGGEIASKVAESILLAPYHVAAKGYKVASKWVGSQVIPGLASLTSKGISALHGGAWKVPIKGLQIARQTIEPYLSSSVADYLYHTKTKARQPFTYRGIQKALHYMAQKPYAAKAIETIGKEIGRRITPVETYKLTETHHAPFLVGTRYKRYKDIPSLSPIKSQIPTELEKAPILTGALDPSTYRPHRIKGGTTIEWPSEKMLRPVTEKMSLKEQIAAFRFNEPLYEAAIKKAQGVTFTKVSDPKLTGWWPFRKMKPGIYTVDLPKAEPGEAKKAGPIISPRFAQWQRRETGREAKRVVLNVGKIKISPDAYKKATIKKMYDTYTSPAKADYKKHFFSLPPTRQIKIREIMQKPPTFKNLKDWRNNLFSPLTKAEKKETIIKTKPLPKRKPQKKHA